MDGKHPVVSAASDWPTIRELTSATRLDSAFYAVLDAHVLHKRDGTPYIRARLRDATGIIAAVVWDNVDDCRAALIPGKIVKVRGRVGEIYNGQGLELTIERIRLANDHECDPTAFVPRTTHDVDQLITDLRGIIASTRTPIQEVLAAALDTNLDRFSHWPAAEELHHAYIGGLLEHSLEVAHLADAIIQVIPGADRDVAVAGALLHDIGKLDAYVVNTTFSASDEGRLVGHVLTGFHRVKVACAAGHAPEDLTLQLLHIVASHHGSVEYGAAREPATREAIVVHFADELSAQLMEVNEAIGSRADATARWTGRVRGLKRDVFIGDSPGTSPDGETSSP